MRFSFSETTRRCWSPETMRSLAVEIDVRCERLVARVHLQDRLAACDVRRGDHDLAIEAPGSQEGRVEVL